MKHLYLLRGNVGAGKTTWLQKNNLVEYALSADNIRLQLESPVLTTAGKYAVSPANDKKVWTLLFDMLQTRMSRGELVFIDATHSRTEDFGAYKHLAQKYRYRLFCIDFTDVPLAVCKKQNQQRVSYKIVADRVLDTIDVRLRTLTVPGYVETIKPDQFEQHFKLAPLDFSKYKRIHIFGDVHGCYTALNEYFVKNKFDINSPDDFYIFIGDYIDRGIQNADVVKWLLQYYNNPNLLLLEGNHERWLRFWSHEDKDSIKSSEFLMQTKPELEAAGLDLKEVRQLCRKFSQLAYFTFNNNTVLVTHGGISTLPDNLLTVATEQFIKGVGKYEDMLTVANTWMETTPTDTIQIAGHRNITSEPIMINPKYYNLEGKIEFGGQLRVVRLSEQGIETDEITNTIFRERPVKLETVLQPSTIVEQLRANRDVNERSFGDISSFNFTKNVFYKRSWTDTNVKARGLFINTKTNEIVARSYNKFFNVNERAETKIDVIDFAYPVTAYKKYNGFLGMLGVDTASDQLLFCSKSSLDGPFAELFKINFLNYYPNIDLEEIKSVLKNYNISLVFEVVDPINDPHIIDCTAQVVLLDVVKRELNYEKFTYDRLETFAKQFGFTYKEVYKVFTSYKEFYNWYESIKETGPEDLEGVVLEDMKGFMTKVKFPYYNFWKHMRIIKDNVRHRRNVNQGTLTTVTANKFYHWCRQQSALVLEQDIITLRKQFTKEYNG